MKTLITAIISATITGSMLWAYDAVAQMRGQMPHGNSQGMGQMQQRPMGGGIGQGMGRPMGGGMQQQGCGMGQGGMRR